LAGILGGCIECYYDISLQERVEEARLALQAVLDTTQDGVLGTYEPDIEVLQHEYEGLQREFALRMEGYGGRLQALWQAIREDLRAQMPYLGDFPVPQAEVTEEVGEGLYNSARDYLAQVYAYKEFQGKLQVS
jgi:hypothetical protein